jgi:hypothetical protein
MRTKAIFGFQAENLHLAIMGIGYVAGKLNLSTDDLLIKPNLFGQGGYIGGAYFGEDIRTLRGAVEIVEKNFGHGYHAALHSH